MSLAPDLIGTPSPVTIGRFVVLAASAWNNPSIIRQLLGRVQQQIEEARAAQQPQQPPPIVPPSAPIVPPSAPIVPPPPPPIVALPPIVAPLPPLRPTPPIAPLPTGGDILQDLLNRPHTSAPARPPTVNPDFERLLRKTPETDLERLMRGTFRPKGGTVARAVGRVAGATARVLGSQALGVLGGVLAPSPLGSDDIISAREAARRGTPRPPRGPRTRPVVSSRPSPRPPTRPVGRPATDPLPPPPLETVLVEAPRLPQPARPAPRPSARPAARPAARPTASPLTLLPYLAPLVPFLLRPGARPLTFALPGTAPLPGLPPGQPLPGLPGPLPGIVSPIPSPGLTPAQPRPVPLPRPLPLLQPPPNDPCRCTTSRKPRKPKQPRTICYAGEYRERSRGLSKDRLRKIPCQ